MAPRTTLLCCLPQALVLLPLMLSFPLNRLFSKRATLPTYYYRQLCTGMARITYRQPRNRRLYRCQDVFPAPL